MPPSRFRFSPRRSSMGCAEKSSNMHPHSADSSYPSVTPGGEGAAALTPWPGWAPPSPLLNNGGRHDYPYSSNSSDRAIPLATEPRPFNPPALNGPVVGRSVARAQPPQYSSAAQQPVQQPAQQEVRARVDCGPPQPAERLAHAQRPQHGDRTLSSPQRPQQHGAMQEARMPEPSSVMTQSHRASTEPAQPHPSRSPRGTDPATTVGDGHECNTGQQPVIGRERFQQDDAGRAAPSPRSPPPASPSSIGLDAVVVDTPRWARCTAQPAGRAAHAQQPQHGDYALSSPRRPQQAASAPRVPQQHPHPAQDEWGQARQEARMPAPSLVATQSHRDSTEPAQPHPSRSPRGADPATMVGDGRECNSRQQPVIGRGRFQQDDAGRAAPSPRSPPPASPSSSGLAPAAHYPAVSLDDGATNSQCAAMPDGYAVADGEELPRGWSREVDPSSGR